MVDPFILEREQPDVVLSLPTERFMVRVPSDSDAHRTIARTVKGKFLLGDTQEFPTPYLLGAPRAELAGGPAQLGKLPWS